jgi:hypothetical protein
MATNNPPIIVSGQWLLVKPDVRGAPLRSLTSTAPLSLAAVVEYRFALARKPICLERFLR